MSSIVVSGLKIVSGLVLLGGGAEVFLKGAVGIALRWNISPLVIGLTIVAFGTSAPELAVSLTAAFAGNPDITIGNIVGSNIANIGLIMGIGALMTPLPASRRMSAVDVPFLLIAGLGVLAVAWWCNAVGRITGALLLLAYCAYMGFLKYWSVRTRTPGVGLPDEARLASAPATARSALMIAAGVAALVAGSRLLVRGAVEAALCFSVSQLVIGLTLTAIGTSLPELATTIAAARKGHGDIVVGNVVGSNMANLCIVLGSTALVAPVRMGSDVIWRDLPAMTLMTLLMLAAMVTGGRVSRPEGCMMLLAYFLYIAIMRIS